MTSFVIKCKTKNGHHSLMGLDPSSSVKLLKDAIKVATGILPENMKVLIGYPPKPLKLENDNQKLSEIGFEKGMNFMIHVEDALSSTSNVKVFSASKNGKDKENEKESVLLTEANEMRNLNEDETALSSSLGIMMRIVVPANNSCLFTSLYFITHDGQLNVTEGSKLRNVISQAIKEKPEEYNSAILGKPNEEYQEWILDPASWGGGIELAIFSEYFKLEICAIDIISCQMHRFGESFNFGTRCFLVYDGIHYDPLVMQYDDRVETIFNTKDHHFIDLAMEVAKEAQSSRQFTDTHNFKLQCMVCGQHLIGDKEATIHAAATGHTNYGELK